MGEAGCGCEWGAATALQPGCTHVYTAGLRRRRRTQQPTVARARGPTMPSSSTTHRRSVDSYATGFWVHPSRALGAAPRPVALATVLYTCNIHALLPLPVVRGEAPPRRPYHGGRQCPRAPYRRGRHYPRAPYHGGRHCRVYALPTRQRIPRQLPGLLSPPHTPSPTWFAASETRHTHLFGFPSVQASCLFCLCDSLHSKRDESANRAR